MDCYANIPGQLKQRPNWVAWGIRGAPPKSPFNPESLLVGRPQPAKAGVRETWSSYQNAAESVTRGLARGIGYEFDGGGNIYGVDLDHVIDENGVTPQAREIVGLLASYTEISPSGMTDVPPTPNRVPIAIDKRKTGVATETAAICRGSFVRLMKKVSAIL